MDEQTKRISDRAAEYFAGSRFETMAHRRAREAWLAEDVRHRVAYDEMQRLWDHADCLRDNAEFKAFMVQGRAALRRSRSSKRMLLLAAALVALAGITGVYWLRAPMAIARYVTAVGERQTDVLADGSRVTLNTNSALEVRFTRGRRDVDLQRGEVLFEVAHDASRPFVVHTGMGSVTALGTRFEVRRDAGANEAVVTLLQGSVAVKQGEAQQMLLPNEQARLSEQGGITVRTIDPAQVDGWVDGWLRFRDATLGEVVAEANRYSVRKLSLADPALAHLRLHGNFHVGDTASIAAAVEQVLPVRVDDRGNEIVLRPEARKK